MSNIENNNGHTAENRTVAQVHKERMRIVQMLCALEAQDAFDLSSSRIESLLGGIFCNESGLPVISETHDSDETVVELDGDADTSLPPASFLPLAEDSESEITSLRVSAEEFSRTCSEIRNICDHLDAIDDIFKKSLKNWTIDRLNPTDRNIIRLAIYEAYIAHTVKPAVAISEAVELAKELSGDRARSFVNGVLARADRGMR